MPDALTLADLQLDVLEVVCPRATAAALQDRCDVRFPQLVPTALAIG